MIEAFDIQSLVDVGLILLLGAAVARALFNKQASGPQPERWKEELKEVERALSGLIDEAGAASRNLDRSLLQRKRELETLLKNIDEKQQELELLPKRQSISASTNAVSKKSSPEKAKSGGDLPNDTWIRGATSDPAAPSTPQVAGYSLSGAVSAPKSAEANALEVDSLERLVEAADDSVSISNTIAASISRSDTSADKGQNDQDQPALLPETPEMKAARERKERMVRAFVPKEDRESLAESIELVRAGTPESDTYNKTSIVDPVTYRIARRLLRGGKEIHVVARKIELPVSEVRLLDKLMRQEQDIDEFEEEKGNGVEVKHIVRPSEVPSSRPPAIEARSGQKKSKIDTDIEREIALL